MNGRDEGTTSSFANTAIYKKFYRPKSTKFEAVVVLEDASDSKKYTGSGSEVYWWTKPSQKVE